MAVVPLRLGESAPDQVRGGIIAVGNFDGVHLGHAALIAAARTEAGSKSVVAVTFDPHPLVLLAPERYQPPLTTVTDRARHLGEIGADHVVVLQTTRELLAQLADAGLVDVAFHVDLTQERKGYASERELNAIRREYIERARALMLP